MHRIVRVEVAKLIKHARESNDPCLLEAARVVEKNVFPHGIEEPKEKPMAKAEETKEDAPEVVWKRKG